MKTRTIASVTGAALAAMIILSVIMPLPAFAGENIPVTIDITVTYIVDGNVKTAGGDSFILEPDDPASPMPEGTEGGKKRITITDEGSFGFGEIRYERPDVYWYTVTRDLTDRKGVIKDNPVYRAKVIALNDGHGYVLVYRKGSDEKEELIYKDRVAPATGDGNPLIIYLGILAAAAATLAVFAALAVRDSERNA